MIGEEVFYMINGNILTMTKFSSFGAGFVYKGDPEVLRTFLSNLERDCKAQGIKMEYKPIMEIEVGS
jgi:hypothetical protein